MSEDGIITLVVVCLVFTPFVCFGVGFLIDVWRDR
jgi:hypothetical protein